MSAPDANGWIEVGEDFETIPNDCFDIIAKYYDAGFDQMMMVRIPGCVRVGSSIVWGAPFPNETPVRYDILQSGYRPTHWRPLPQPPITNSSSSTPPAMTNLPEADPSTVSGTPSIQEPK